MNRNEMQENGVRDKDGSASRLPEQTYTGINTENQKYFTNVETCNLDVDFILFAIYGPHQIIHSSEQ